MAWFGGQLTGGSKQRVPLRSRELVGAMVRRWEQSRSRGRPPHAGDRHRRSGGPGIASDDQNKRQYTLFNPTPDRLLRDLTTDRPDATETPFTVDAGRIQTETNLFGYARSAADADGAVTDGYEFATTNIRVGLTHNLRDQRRGRTLRDRLHTRPLDPAAGRPATQASAASYIRGKFNLWGNDAFEQPGATALGLLPFVALPTDRNNGISPEAVEGGMIVPVRGEAVGKVRARDQCRCPCAAKRRQARVPRGVSGHGVAVIRMDRGAEQLLRGRGALQHRQSARRRRRAGDRLHLQAKQEPAARWRRQVRRDPSRRPDTARLSACRRGTSAAQSTSPCRRSSRCRCPGPTQTCCWSGSDRAAHVRRRCDCRARRPAP